MHLIILIKLLLSHPSYSLLSQQQRKLIVIFKISRNPIKKPMAIAIPANPKQIAKEMYISIPNPIKRQTYPKYIITFVLLLNSEKSNISLSSLNSSKNIIKKN